MYTVIILVASVTKGFNNIIDLLYIGKPEYTAYSCIALKSLPELHEHSKDLSVLKCFKMVFL